MDIATLVVLHELIDSNDEKPHREKTIKWMKRRSKRGFLSNIKRDLWIEDRLGFREMFRMGVTDFEFILAQISDLISPKQRFGGSNPIECDSTLFIDSTLLGGR